MGLLMRYQWESYMGIIGEGASETFSLIGEGFTSFPESKGAKEYTRKYICDKTERSDVIGYAPSRAYSCDAISDNPVCQEIMKITDDEHVGEDAQRTIVAVNTWETAEGGGYVAYKRVYAIVPDTKGDGTDALVYSGTMKAVSDLIKGSFDRETNKFTPFEE